MVKRHTPDKCKFQGSATTSLVSILFTETRQDNTDKVCVHTIKHIFHIIYGDMFILNRFSIIQLIDVARHLTLLPGVENLEPCCVQLKCQMFYGIDMSRLH